MANKAVTVAGLGSAVYVTADVVLLQKRMPRPRTYMALLFVFLILAYLAQFAPSIAAAFAVFIFLSLIFSNGDKVFGAINSKFGKE